MNLKKGAKIHMKKNNPLKKLKILKKTIAHLHYEQLKVARGGTPLTMWACTDTVKDSITAFCKLTEKDCV
jgi:hypothetical protein